MASTKEFDNKLKSLKNTRKLTYTMKLVSMSKLYRAQENQRKAKVYAKKLTDLIFFLTAYLRQDLAHPLLLPHEKKDSALILLITSDRGLAGGFNNSLIQTVDAWIHENGKKYKTIGMSCCGKRGYMHFKRGLNIWKYYSTASAKPDFHVAKQIGADLAAAYNSGQYDEIFIAYNSFHSPLLQTAVFDQVLPISPSDVLTGDGHMPGDYIFEPAQTELLSFLIPKYLYFRIYFALLENTAGEHGARMTAMENATKNANKLIEKFTLYRNRARQASITTELLEIITGAEALNQG